MADSQSSSFRAVAVVVAGGTGSRMGGPTPKQFLDLAGEPVLMHSLRAFDEHPAIEAICVVVAEEHQDRLRSEAPWSTLRKNLILAAPGPERRDSVRNGLAAVQGRAEAVLIHDAARPLVTQAMITDLLREVAAGHGAIVARPVADTLKREGQGHTIAGTVDRAGLWQAETPQGFPFDLIWQAHQRAEQSGIALTDDAQAVEMLAEGQVVLCAAATPNPKITRPADLALVEALLRAQREGAPA